MRCKPAVGELIAPPVHGWRLLSAGSRSPEELGRIVDVDLTDPGFWDQGLSLIERKLEAAEQAARESGRV
jgi:oligoendopeptidase F